MTHAPHPTTHLPNLRPFRNADAPAVARLVTASVRGHWTYTPAHFREAQPGTRPTRLVAEQDGVVVATARLAPFGAGVPDALRLDVAGDGASFTPLLLAQLAEAPGGFRRVLGVTREDFTEQMTFFAAAGFRNAWQSWGAHLDLTTFDPVLFEPLQERLFLAGYEPGRLSPDAPDADWDALSALHQTGVRDQPRNPTTIPDPLTRDGLRDVIRREEAAFVTRWRGQIVALTRLTPRGPEVDSEGSVTHQGHRARGVMTALKAHALTWAQGAGHTHAGTGGTVLNLPMLRVNTRLGYRVDHMWITWEKELCAVSSEGKRQPERPLFSS
ncbi:GNAT family N-acetyltransferase [Deinococcus soli (ex Cha et al. 2016)]|uniref:GNAT superfamily N-acetyltransferase n=2 Tax=Deinococcus soli (ex Cha et al. 2016) TaxID=1309411 RepID=A0AAE4BNR2_9DEIO|nr:GNAT family N-acetyltransferase [Deinococcus soli (ex Cha et al. 2016)]MDR6219832.1 GNAT superfamily N-acetyltransferase [Deinococcus soli (ex Cha et al. 2016)]MDR6329910.1 GNAT superfamily N-acetyltransferase [Deinococcus soli (ex Cha et al. 2016)]MDR6752739.1 GNAT superfamily N-acetyltransferase [Deinococcus soli (ex Cha et al. 2016)]